MVVLVSWLAVLAHSFIRGCVALAGQLLGVGWLSAGQSGNWVPVFHVFPRNHHQKFSSDLLGFQGRKQKLARPPGV